MADLFKLQDEVVARLANSLGNELVKAEARRDERISHPDAFDLTHARSGACRCESSGAAGRKRITMRLERCTNRRSR